MEPVYVAKDPHEKAMQRALLQWKNPKNRPLVLEALRKAGREDLIGRGKHCLVWDDAPGKRGRNAPTGKRRQLPRQKSAEPRKNAPKKAKRGR